MLAHSVLTCSGSVASQIMSKYGWKEGQGENILFALTRLNWWTNTCLLVTPLHVRLHDGLYQADKMSP